MTDYPTTKLRWLGSVRGPLFLPELRHIPPPNTPLMITSQHPPRIVIQTLKRSWNGRAERAAGGLLSGSGHAAALVAFVSDAAAGAPHDFGNGRLIERGRVMSFPRERIGNVDRVAVKKAHQLGVESGRAVLAAP